MSLRFRLLAAGAALVLAANAAMAADTAPKKPLTAQQQRMADCSKQSAGKKGAEHKAFVSSCLKGEAAAAPAAKQTQQEKMKSCNVDAKTKALTGDARKSFMSNCLKGSPSP
ncbi:PsiF family protein [Frateuria defendens]|uniref:PsiF family protein n=1 Tax=Frateuria defendens TaxID=2219559 RepID=UPI00066FE245|nr:PsiF family protein [Frateuria defendens]